MMNAKTALDLILKGMEPALREAEFVPVKSAEEHMALFEGEPGMLRIKVADERAALQLCTVEPDMAADGDYKQLSLSLLELERADERDCQSIANEFAEVVNDKFRKRKKGAAAAGVKPPKSISKAAIRNGEAYYDALSFGNSFTAMFPELRAAYKENYERYGEFLAEEFFLTVGNNLVADVIRRNNPAQMKRMFALFNEVYENGVNDVQSLIAVTVLGTMESDEMLLRCTDYMSDDLAPVVIRINSYLKSGAGAGARKKLENPPLYKPKKKKKKGLFQSIMDGSAQQQLGQ